MENLKCFKKLANKVLANQWTYSDYDCKFIKCGDWSAYVGYDGCLFLGVKFKGRHLFEKDCCASEEKFAEEQMKDWLQSKLKALKVYSNYITWAY